MGDNENFEVLAEQLLKDIGVKDSSTLDFFQTKPLSTDWKSSIKKVPSQSPPKNRRTGSSGTAHSRLMARQWQQQQQQNGTQSQRKLSNEQNVPSSNLPRKLSGERNGTRRLSNEHISPVRRPSNEHTSPVRRPSNEHTSPVRRFSGEQISPKHHSASGEKISRSPQHQSTSSNSSSAGQTNNNKTSGGHDRRFGYGGSVNAANRTHTQTVRSLYSLHAQIMHSSHSVLHILGVSQSIFIVFNAVANNACCYCAHLQGQSSLTGSPTRTRRVIARPAPKPPMQQTGAHAKKSEAVIKMTPAIRHSSSAGAIVNGNPNSANRPSNVRASTSVAPTIEPNTTSLDKSKISKPTSISPVKPKDQVRRIVSNPDKTTFQVIQTKPASFKVLSTSSHRILHTSEDGGDSKRKQALQTGYTVDAPAIPSAAGNPMKTARSVSTTNIPFKVSAQTKGSVRNADLNGTGIYDNLSPPTSPLREPSPPVRVETVTTLSVKLSEAQSLSGAYDRLSPVELAAIRQISQLESNQKRVPLQSYHRASVSPSSSNSDSSQSQLENRRNKQTTNNAPNLKQSNASNLKQSNASNLKQSNAPNPKQSNAPNPKQSNASIPKQSNVPNPKESNASIPKQSNVPNPAPNLKESNASNPKQSNLPVTSDKSSSQIPKKPIRRHSSADHHIKSNFSSTSVISQHPAAKISDSRLELSIQSPSSSSTTTLSSPEPLSDRQTPDSDERRTQLESVHWSRQSLDRNMSAVATDTVQALSTLIEVLTPDPDSKLNEHFKYEGSPVLPNPNWYEETDDSDTSSYPLSPLSPEFIFTSSCEPEPTPSPRVLTPLKTSVSDSSISTATKSETKVMQRVRFADSPVEIVELKKSVLPEKFTLPEKTILSDKLVSSTSIERNKKKNSRESVTNIPENKSQTKKFSNRREPASTNQKTLEEKNPSPESPDGVIVNGVDINDVKNGLERTNTGGGDPLLHDYAILDPEYHTDFFGK